MAAIDPATLDRWRTLSIVDRDGGTVGSISEFYLDRETRYPTWALVNIGLFGARQMFVPLLGATEIRDGLQVPYDRSQIKDAPRIDLHGELTPDDEATLFAHYGIDYQPATDEAGVAEVAGAAGTAEDAGAAGVGTAEDAGAAGVGTAEDAVAESGGDEYGGAEAEAGDAEPGADERGVAEEAAEPGSPEHAAAAADQDPATPDEWAAAGRHPADDNPGQTPATDELTWPASPPPPELPRADRDR